MTNNILIREAGASDAAALAGLITELGYPTQESEMAIRLNHISKEKNYTTFVAVCNGAIAAMAGTQTSWYYELNGSYVRIVAFVTKATFRKLGIGKALILHIEKTARQAGAAALFLNCGNRAERNAAHAFYKRLGFEGKSTGYVKKLG